MKTRVGVVRGGPSSEYDVSLQTGANVLRHLPEDKYIGTDILLSKDGQWHRNGLPSNLEDIQQHVDVVWNALHGHFGEDGKAQRMFAQFGIPYTGSESLPSSIAMNKVLTKEHVRPLGVRFARWDVIGEEENLEGGVFRVFQSLGIPVVVKPASGGSSVATRIAKSFQELGEAVVEASAYGDVLVEEFIKGREATVCVVDAEASGEVLVLHPIEIIPDLSREFFDYEAKYQGKSEELYPGNFDENEREQLRALASQVHRGLGLRHYSRSDFILSSRGIYFLEVNTLPGLTEASLLPKALSAEGISVGNFLDHVLQMALR